MFYSIFFCSFSDAIQFLPDCFSSCISHDGFISLLSVSSNNEVRQASRHTQCLLHQLLRAFHIYKILLILCLSLSLLNGFVPIHFIYYFLVKLKSKFTCFCLIFLLFNQNKVFLKRNDREIIEMSIHFSFEIRFFKHVF